MSHLNDYLAEKRAAVLARNAAVEAGTAKPAQLKASVTAEGRSGVRRLRIREHQVISDSPPDFAGYNLGPSSPELQLGVLGTCVTHIFLIHAAERQVPLESLEVEVTGVIDPRGGKPGHEKTPIWPHEIGYTVHIDSPASREDIDALFEAVERNCPILNLLRNPQTIRAEVKLVNSRAKPPMPSLLEIRGLVRRFGGLTAVNAVDLHVGEGELLSVIGPNGAGKTTLFNLVTGLDRPDAGQVLFDGQDITGLPAQQLAQRGLARTFQHGRAFANLSVLDNVLVGAHTRLCAVKPRVGGVPGLGALAELALALVQPGAVRREEQALREEAHAIIALFGERLAPRTDHPAYSLSYANRRRVEIARALALKPRLLLLDEPTAGMNESETAEMLEIIRGLKARGQTILLIEHKLDLVMQLSDRVVVLDDGRKIAEGLPDDVRNDPAVIEAYLGHRHVGEAVPA